VNATIASAASVLNSLIKTCNDGNQGFQWAARKVGIPEFEVLFVELASQRRQFAAELVRLVLDLGAEAESTGSFKGAVHRAWINLKAMTTNEDTHDILLECKRGETAALTEYGYALDYDELPTGIFNVIRRQYIAVKAAHDRLEDFLERLSG
jgi:uncharacterized protein (TIGR02284 family)